MTFVNAPLEKELEINSRLFKSFGMKGFNAVDDSYQFNGDIAKNQMISSFNWAGK